MCNTIPRVNPNPPEDGREAGVLRIAKTLLTNDYRRFRAATPEWDEQSDGRQREYLAWARQLEQAYLGSHLDEPVDG